MVIPNFLHTILLDFETTGLDKFRDGILEIYAKVICPITGKVIEVFKQSCKSESFKAVSPKALFANNYSVEKLLLKDHPLEVSRDLFEFIKRYPKSEILAFNANFDFGFSFNTFFQGINADPYCFKTNGRSVVCMMEILRALEATAMSSAIHIPMIRGAKSFKQADVCMSSGIFYLPHAAETDVSGLERLLSLVTTHHPEYLDQARFFSKKNNALDFINSKPFFVAPIGFRNRFSVRCLAPLSLCDRKINLLCADIGRFSQMDFENVQSHSASNIAHRDLIEPEQHYPLVEVPLNKSKIFFDESYYESSNFGSKIGKTKLLERANAIFKNSALQGFAERIQHFKKIKYEGSKSGHIEEALFDNFTSSNEISFANDFQNIPIEDKYKFLVQEKGNFKHNRYHKLAMRFILDAYPEHCPASIVSKFYDWRRNRLFGSSDGKIRTFQIAANEISFLKRAHPNSTDRINQIENYISYRKDEVENA